MTDLTFAELERRCADWHEKKYGHRSAAGPRTFAKLAEEFGELAEAWNDRDADALAIEAADMVIVLIHFVRGAGRSLSAALVSKLAVIEERLTNPQAGR